MKLNISVDQKIKEDLSKLARYSLLLFGRGFDKKISSDNFPNDQVDLGNLVNICEELKKIHNVDEVFIHFGEKPNIFIGVNIEVNDTINYELNFISCASILTINNSINLMRAEENELIRFFNECFSKMGYDLNYLRFTNIDENYLPCGNIIGRNVKSGDIELKIEGYPLILGMFEELNKTYPNKRIELQLDSMVNKTRFCALNELEEIFLNLLD